MKGMELREILRVTEATSGWKREEDGAELEEGSETYPAPEERRREKSRLYGTAILMTCQVISFLVLIRTACTGGVSR